MVGTKGGGSSQVISGLLAVIVYIRLYQWHRQLGMGLEGAQKVRSGM